MFAWCTLSATFYYVSLSSTLDLSSSRRECLPLHALHTTFTHLYQDNGG